MADYIDRDRLIAEAQKDGAYGYVSVEEIAAAPAADVVERKKGEWIDREVFTAKGNVDMLQSALCPVCERYHTTPYAYYFTNYKFCPNCGADMRGDADGG